MRRHNTLIKWIQNGQKYASFAEVIKFVFSLPFHNKGKKKLESIKEDDKYFIVKFIGISHPIYWPKSASIDHLYQVAAELLYTNWWNYEIEKNKVNEDDIVVDCGAAEGMFALTVQNRCKKCYAVEPLPQFIAAMGKTFENLNNIEIVPFAVSNNVGELLLSQDGINSRLNDENGIKVQMDTMDNLFYHQQKPVTFIKADLEGHEVSMLEGATNILKYYAPKLVITTYHNQKDADLTCEVIKDSNPGYKIKLVGVEDRFGTPIMLHAWV